MPVRSWRRGCDPCHLVASSGGSWTATINSKVTPSDFTGAGNSGIYFSATHSTLTIGASVEVAGYTAGVYSANNGGVDITNKGTIISTSPSGGGIAETIVAGDYTINNSDTITSAFHAIDLTLGSSGVSGGTHTIINSGTIDAPIAIISENNSCVEKVTNSGLITEDVDLGVGDDRFTDFAKVKMHGMLVTKYGTINALIDLGDGNDHFNGGNNAENVIDGNGTDTYKLGGGNDTYIAVTSAHEDGGADLVDGGTGIDTFDVNDGVFSQGWVINLDTHACPEHGYGEWRYRQSFQLRERCWRQSTRRHFR